MRRIFSIDFTRGLVMVIMALDHVRDLLHVHSIDQSPTNLSTTTPILFFTRWITYLCAPTFVFLAGTSAYISLKNKGNILQTRSFLLQRGLWLILLEFTLVNFALFFDLGFHNFIFEVIATIGFGFIVLGLLAKASPKTIGIIGLLIITCHELVQFISIPESSTLGKIFMAFFVPGGFPISKTIFRMAYPPIPWLGILLVGFACGKFFQTGRQKRKKLFTKIGLAALLLFIALRFINLYGDPAPWSVGKNPIYTILSFVNITKYPPSLLFCLATLGIMFLILAVAENLKGLFMNMVTVYGRVPLFYFVVHFYLIHVIMVAVLFMQGFSLSQMDFAGGTFGRPQGVESGLSLGVIYCIWLGVVLALYKPCLWFSQYKAEHKYWWLRFI